MYDARELEGALALCDSNYLAGLKAGWNLGVASTDPREGPRARERFHQIIEARRREIVAARKPTR